MNSRVFITLILLIQLAVICAMLAQSPPPKNPACVEPITEKD